MSSAELYRLRRQRATVVQGISNSREQISILADKITRLRSASSNLQGSISSLETSKQQINSLSIDKNSWKGKNQTKFESRYDAYKDSVKDYVDKTIDAREGIEDEIRRLENTRMAYTNGLSNLQSTLNSLDYQISRAKED
ncbi:YwqH-like family protein [Sediminibacillus terrae]|uniref:YwqH-like family protein n=1 Tax=Sediminibacillus terrae TaxID=1562106 RepID=UPI0012971C92|nr:DUF5082 family protein [Sediminibacillus terrae]